jgi:hypothetical protein
MDELTLLRELDADAPPPTRDARLAARTRLEREIERPPAARRRRPSWDGQKAALLLLVLTVIGAGVVVARDMGDDGGELTPSDLGRADPAPDVLELADRGEEAPGLPATMRPGQYLYTRSVIEATPLDPGGIHRTLVDEGWLPTAGQDLPSRTCELGRCWTSPGGGVLSAEELDRIPREPRRLILYARAQHDPSRPSEPFTEIDWQLTYEFLFGLLRTPLIVPPDLRAAAVRALAYTPDARVLDEQLEFRGRPAAVIYTPSWKPGSVIDRYIADIIVDRHTHEYLGQRWELGPADMKGPRNQRLFNSSRVRLVSHLEEAAIVDRLGERP